MVKGVVLFKNWQKLDLRVGKIIEAEDIEGADKLFKLKVDLGTETRILLAGLKGFYNKDELINRRCVVVCNLEPKKMKGIKSEGMLLAAVNDDESEVVLIAPEKAVEDGARVC